MATSATARSVGHHHHHVHYQAVIALVVVCHSGNRLRRSGLRLLPGTRLGQIGKGLLALCRRLLPLRGKLAGRPPRLTFGLRLTAPPISLSLVSP